MVEILLSKTLSNGAFESGLFDSTRLDAAPLNRTLLRSALLKEELLNHALLHWVLLNQLLLKQAGRGSSPPGPFVLNVAGRGVSSSLPADHCALTIRVFKPQPLLVYCKWKKVCRTDGGGPCNVGNTHLQLFVIASNTF